MNRLIKCNESHEPMLLQYLKEEAVRNTFLIGDVMNYGFCNEIQQVWMDVEADACTAVYLWFCNNLLIYSHKEALNEQSLRKILDIKKLDQAMAKSSHLQQILALVDGYEMKSKSLLAYNKELLLEDNKVVYSYRIGTLEDVDCIYNFLQSGELAPLYRSREMIEQRIATKEGVHLLIEEQGQIVAHINSAASTPYSTMIGGLFTNEGFRGLGMASFLVRSLCREIMKEGKIPCLISAQSQAHNLFYSLGFEEVEAFTTLEPR